MNWRVYRVIHFADTKSRRRIPRNTGLCCQMDMGYHAGSYQYLPPENALKAVPVIPVLKVTLFFSDSCKIAWMRAFVGWLMTEDPGRDMTEHDSLIHYIRELFSRQGLERPCPQRWCGLLARLLQCSSSSSGHPGSPLKQVRLCQRLPSQRLLLRSRL